jgi:hypothetical protein
MSYWIYEPLCDVLHYKYIHLPVDYSILPRLDYINCISHNYHSIESAGNTKKVELQGIYALNGLINRWLQIEIDGVATTHAKHCR